MHQPIKHRKANRMSSFDYSTEVLYFVMSCVQDMVCSFGQIVNECL
jgi:hypothetical protein